MGGLGNTCLPERAGELEYSVGYQDGCSGTLVWEARAFIARRKVLLTPCRRTQLYGESSEATILWGTGICKGNRKKEHAPGARGETGQ